MTQEDKDIRTLIAAMVQKMGTVTISEAALEFTDEANLMTIFNDLTRTVTLFYAGPNYYDQEPD